MAIVDKKLDKLDERLRDIESSLATLSSEITIITKNLKENMTRDQSDVLGRIGGLRVDMKDNDLTLTNDLKSLEEKVGKLYVSHGCDQHRIKFNEKFLWVFLTGIASAGFFLLQNFLKSGGS